MKRILMGAFELLIYLAVISAYACLLLGEGIKKMFRGKTRK